MDIGAVLGDLQRGNAGLRAEAERLRAELRAVVDEYNVVETSLVQSAGHVRVLGDALVETSRVYFRAIRALWAAASRPPSVDEGEASSRALDEEAQRSLVAALGHATSLSASLGGAGLGDVARRAAVDDADRLAAAAVGFTTDSVRLREREVFTTALREVRALADSNAAAAAHAHTRADAAERDANEQRRAATEARTELQQANAKIAVLEEELLRAHRRADEAWTAAQSRAHTHTHTHTAAPAVQPAAATVEVQGRIYTAGDVQDLLDRYNASVAALARSGGASSVRVCVRGSADDAGHAGDADGRADARGRSMTADPDGWRDSARPIGVEPASSALTRESVHAAHMLAQAQARAREAETRMADEAHTHTVETAALRAQLTTAEASMTALTRTVTSLRSELGILSDKYAAQTGVVDMLRLELADAHARLTKLSTHKIEMARKAASALAQVEGQVSALTASVAALADTKRAARV